MLHVLIIDDDKGISAMLKCALIPHGYDVETSSNGTEGTAAFDKGCYDAVITDICMPGMNGTNVAHYIRDSAKPLTPVIGISGTPWLLDSGDFDAVLEKPFSISALLSTLQLLTKKKRCLPGLQTGSKETTAVAKSA